jgi:hypothetical protein
VADRDEAALKNQPEEPSLPKGESIVKNMNQEKFAGMSVTKLAVFAVAGYTLWKNRFRIQEFLEAQGVKTPWLKSDIGEAVQSGAAKFSGSLRNGMNNDRSAAV